MNKIGVKTLSGVTAAEKTLRRVEFKDLLEAMPEGHPLRDEAERVSAEAGGDLEGLPEGHPLIVQLKQAKDRYEADVGEETDDAQDNTRKLKKAKKVDRSKKRRAKIAEEEEGERRHREAAVLVNKGIDGVMEAITDLYKTVDGNEEVLCLDPLTRSRMARLKRMLYASERGLSDSRISRVVNHGR